VTVAKPDIVPGQAEKDPSPKFAIQIASGGTLSILKEALLTLTLGRRPPTTFVYVVSIADEFIRRPGAPCATNRRRGSAPAGP
jgi:hypothetical protein